MDSVADIRSKGTARKVPLRDLRLDAHNPRLSPDDQEAAQEDLALSLELGFEAVTVAESIASHGFFGSEPLIVIAGDEPGTWVVVEGNRRLTALLGLADARLRAQFAGRKQWDVLASQAGVRIEDLIPVVVLADRAEATPIIGFRHISGILQWEPFAQARYIARLVDEDGMTFKEVAEMIGIDRTRVGNLYRDQAIVAQAESLGIETGHIERAFSLMTVAMSTTKLRNHVGADLGARTVPGVPPVPADRTGALRELITWVYGDGEIEPVVAESRAISKLGNVVASEPGLAALRRGESLDVAIQTVKDHDEDPRGRLLRRLRTGKNALAAALEDLPDFGSDAEVTEAVDEAKGAVDALLAALGDV
ncbi:hypothetical protein [uncultured Cellulomonas sp.]|uniref:hypothetical protein n=1 Tax=uncultured Cellulomonas sp. TaxID=189682 RepID=UPI0028E43C5D|nr:hypothetical protein [uncultured Cellulomonas sp.]